MADLLHLLLLATVAAAFWSSEKPTVVADNWTGQPREWPPQLSFEESVLTQTITNETIAAASYYFTHGLHLAGMNLSQASWTVERWVENGFNARIVEYNVYINYPKAQALELHLTNGTSFTLDLEEAILDDDPTTSAPDRTPSFHGYSASGIVSSQFLYVGQGKREDFDRLVNQGVELKGNIAIARYGGGFRGDKVLLAQQHGMIACVIFTDLADDANYHTLGGQNAKPYPEGVLRNPTSVERGSVMQLAQYAGDPTTPGVPSLPGANTTDKYAVLPKIPSLPFSFSNAGILMPLLDGYGPMLSASSLKGWYGALQAQYSVGPNPNAKLTLTNNMQDDYKPIWDVIGVINGTEQDEVIIVGNHRDAWIVGGAGDPNGGSAIIIAMSKAFNSLLHAGWKPRRTIVLASWDMEEYGLVGSTEFVEEYLPWLKVSALAYINCDIATSGPIPHVSATPELQDLVTSTMKKVIWPNHGSGNISEQQTLYDVFNAFSGEIEPLGGGSDFTAFLHNGISAIDIGSHGGQWDPTFHHNSNFDSYEWMKRFGDPKFEVHVAIGQWLSLLTYRLASDQVIAFNVSTYTARLRFYAHQLAYDVGASKCCTSLNLTSLESAIKVFNASATAIAGAHYQAVVQQNTTAMQEMNTRYKYFQRAFTSQGGLPGRQYDFYKHVVMAPSLDSYYEAATFPGITEAITVFGNLTLAAEWVAKTSAAITLAAQVLNGNVIAHVLEGGKVIFHPEF